MERSLKDHINITSQLPENKLWVSPKDILKSYIVVSIYLPTYARALAPSTKVLITVAEKSPRLSWPWRYFQQNVDLLGIISVIIG